MAGDTVRDLWALRRAMRSRRRALPDAVRRARAGAVADRCLPSVGEAAHLAAYVAVAGELDPGPLAAQVRRRGGQVLLPAVDGEVLRFRAHAPGVALEPGRFGVPEPPAGGHELEAAELDVVVVPLVAFDRSGTRLGTGAGFYDRTLGPVVGQVERPLVVGLAYAFQEVASLPRRPWDVPLDLVVTEAEVIRTGTR